MKKNTLSLLSLLSLLLAVIMMLGAFVSCTDGATDETKGSETTAPEASEKETADEGTKPAESGTEESAPADSEDSDTTASETEPAIEFDNSLLIENAQSLANGVNAYFTSGKRSDFMLENQNMSLEYALAAYKDQQITYLANKNGARYIESTSDVFVKMTNGNVFYASDSTRAATANLYRFGYYMYEARFEEQFFGGDVIVNDFKQLDVEKFRTRNHVKISKADDGSTRVTIGNTTDPYIYLNDVEYATADYNFIQIKLRTSTTKMTSGYLYVWTDTDSSHQVAGFSIYPDGEYHTYTVDLSQLKNYSGNVTKIRLDFENHIKVQDTYDISEIRLVKGEDGGRPAKLSLNRSFFVYSDKLHHIVQIATDQVATENIASAGLETKINADTVAQIVVKDKNGLHYDLELKDIDWDSAEYVGFDIKEAGIFGYIMPADGRGDKLEVALEDGVYTIVQSRTPKNGTIIPSAYYDAEKKRYFPVEGCEDENSNANDFFMGQRIYTDENHDFEKFIYEAENERNPLAKENFLLSVKESSYQATYSCPKCGFKSDENMLVCSACKETVTFNVNANMYYIGYEPLRGIYQFYVPEEGFNNPYYMYPNKHINLTFRVTGDDRDRDIYVMSLGTKMGCLECAVLLDENKMMLPVPIEVGKNFSEGSGERNLWNVEDHLYSEAIFPMVIKAGSQDKYTLLNLYQNWGQYPLKQVSWIQFYAPYYHLSTGVTETNCIVPYYSCKNARGLNTLPDHRAMSAPLWAGQPQHTSGGTHIWLAYTDANGVYSASENTLDRIDSHGPIYADVYFDYITDDGNIKVSYVHTEFPQTDENRAYYEMNYEVLGDVSFTDFSRDFSFYKAGDNDSKGSYINVGYLNENNESVIVDAAKGEESFKYVLGDECPYFSFFNMPDYDKQSTSAEGYVNLSFLIYNYEFVIGGEKVTPRFAIINEENKVRISLDLGEVTLKAGDKFTINAIVMPWGSQESVYDSDEFAGDQNVRDVRENTLLNPLTPVAGENCETIESVFVPKVRTTNGKDATFTLKGGQNNCAVRVYGFRKLTVPKIQELVDGEWVDYQVSSAYKPDNYGNGHYYDGYSVHYDADGTFSYAFIVPMDYKDADGRTFRIAADTDFEGWPRELPEVDTEIVELPLNIYVNAPDLYAAMKRELGKAIKDVILAPDGSFTSVFANGTIEAYFHPFFGDGGKTVSGKYFIMKYRIPTTNESKYSAVEIFTSTKDTSKEGCSFYISEGFVNDGKWHVIAVDLSAWNKTTFQPNDKGEYRAQYLRLDIFNGSYNNGSIDLAYVGMHDDLNDLYELNADINEITVVTEKNKVTTYDSKGNVISTPSDEAVADPADGFNKYFVPSTLADKAINSAGGHSGATVTSADGSYVEIHYDTNEARARVESYFSVFKGNSDVTGQYLVLKYRTSKPVGYIEIYTSTTAEGASNAERAFLYRDQNYLFVADGQWHTVAIDLSGVIKTFTPNDKGEYIAKFLRLDFFNYGKFTSEANKIDLAFVGFCDSYEEAIGHDDNTFFFDGEKSINAGTGKPLTPPAEGESDSESGGSESESTPPTISKETYLAYFDAEDIVNASNAPGNGHAGTEELMEDGAYARFHNCTKEDASTAARLESYIYLLKDNTAPTGQYMIIKYRVPGEVGGSIQVYTSTQYASVSDSGGSLSLTEAKSTFIRDNKWHIVVIDLSKVVKTFTASNAAYTPKHLRIDLFNFGKVTDSSADAYVDLAYVAMTDDYNKILGKDASVESLIFFDGEVTSIPNQAK